MLSGEEIINAVNNGKIIRPAYKYVGKHKEYLPIDERIWQNIKRRHPSVICVRYFGYISQMDAIFLALHARCMLCLYLRELFFFTIGIFRFSEILFKHLDGHSFVNVGIDLVTELLLKGEGNDEVFLLKADIYDAVNILIFRRNE